MLTQQQKQTAESWSYEVREQHALELLEDAARTVVKALSLASTTVNKPTTCILRDALRHLDEVRSGI